MGDPTGPALTPTRWQLRQTHLRLSTAARLMMDLGKNSTHLMGAKDYVFRYDKLMRP